MSTIYVITEGIYSDYHIIAATTDKAKAETIVKLCSDKYNSPDIEEYSDDYSPTTDNKYIYKEETGQLDKYTWCDNDDAWGRNQIYGALGKRTVKVVANDEYHARKKIYDMLAKDKAERLGL